MMDICHYSFVQAYTKPRVNYNANYALGGDYDMSM